MAKKILNRLGNERSEDEIGEFSLDPKLIAWPEGRLATVAWSGVLRWHLVFQGIHHVFDEIRFGEDSHQLITVNYGQSSKFVFDE